MACEDQISTQSLENAETNAITLGEVATSRAGAASTGDIIDTATNMFGETTDTVTGRLKKMGYAVPVVYAGGISFALADNVKTVDEGGVVYAPLASALPFTTSGTWVGDDEDKFFTVQGLTNDQLINGVPYQYNFTTVAAMVLFTASNTLPLNKVLTVSGENNYKSNYIVTNVVSDVDLGGGLWAKLLPDELSPFILAADTGPTRKIEVLACVIRQDDVDPTVWDFIDDADHERLMPIGATIDTAPVGANTVRINFNKTYSKIVSSAVVSDEDLSEKGIVVGASVDNSDAVIYFSKNKQLKAAIWYDGGWNFANETTGNGSMSPEVTSLAFASNTLQITHKEINGSNNSLSPLVRAASPATVPYMAVAAGGNGTTRTDVKFVNTSGNFVGAADSKMVVNVNWYDGNVVTNTYKDRLDEGNVWFFAVMQV